jgi:hypothetical protein
MMSFKERLQKAFPVWRQMLKRNTPFVRQTSVAGGAAGVIAVADIKKGDQLVSVIESASGVLTDRTSEFVANTNDGQLIVNDAEIDNTGGTATTGDSLLVTWIAWGE